MQNGFRGSTHNPLLSIFACHLPGRGYICIVFISEVCQCCCVIWWKSFCVLAVLVLQNSPVCQSYDFKLALNTIVVSKTNVSCHICEMQSHCNSVTEAQLHPQTDLCSQQILSLRGGCALLRFPLSIQDHHLANPQQVRYFFFSR